MQNALLSPMIDTFLACADAGSFTKAAEKLYISPTAVMKQINQLESALQVSLFERRRTGVVLTPAGEVIKDYALRMEKLSEEGIKKARALEGQEEKIFRVGTSLLNPAKPFMDLWYQYNRDFPDYRIHLVPFEDDHEGILHEIRQLGSRYDFLIGVCDSKEWLTYCSFYQLGTWKKRIALPRSHPLAKKDDIDLNDLAGQELLMVPRGDSGSNDAIRDFLNEHYPAIRITDTPPFFDMGVFNEAVEKNCALLLSECWENVHPGLKSLAVSDPAWNFTIPYGLIYAKNPSAPVRAFVARVRDGDTKTGR